MDGLIFDVNRNKRFNEKGELIIETLEKEEKPMERKQREIHFSDERVAELKELYSHVCVRDFGDDYHLSQEEKMQNSDLYKVYGEMSRNKSRYKKINEFVIAMRRCHRYVLAVAEKNKLIMNPKEFVKKVYRGKINLAYFQVPKYAGPDKKDINYKNVVEYILDESLDPNDLVRKKTREYLDSDVYEDPAAHIHEYFSEEQIRVIFKGHTDLSYIDKEDRCKYNPTYDMKEDGFITMGGGHVRKIKDKEFKKLIKRFPDMERPMKEMRNYVETDDALRSFAYSMQSDAFEQIVDQEKHSKKNKNGRPTFKGSYLNKKDVKRYLNQLDEYYEENTYVTVNGKAMTISEYKEEKLRNELDRAGWNVMNIYNNKEKLKKQKEKDKKFKEKAKRLRRELSHIEEQRTKNRDKGKEWINTKKKKDKKKKKKLTIKLGNK